MKTPTNLRLLCSIVLAAAILPSCAEAASQSAISRRLDKLAQRLIKEYHTAGPEAGKSSLAVFEFSTSKKLAKERVGFAISELLMRRFVKNPEFVVVEREKTVKILEEQRLQQTGVIDAETAVQIGKLMGVRVLLLGSVQKLGQKYQVTARLVSVESGEVLAMGYEELEERLFEHAARPYLTRIPEKQKIGFYFLYNFRRNSNNLPAQQVGNVLSWPATYDRTLTPHSFNLGLLGGGIRYYPFEHWMFDLSVAAQTAEIEAAAVDNPAGAFPDSTMIRKTMILRANINWTTPLRPSLNGILGAGISRFSSTPSGATFKTTVAPMIRGGLEYKIQRRMALGFFLNYEFINTAGYPGELPPFLQLPNKTPAFKFSKLSFEPTIAIYF